MVSAHRLAVRTPPFHGGNRGSIPLGRTSFFLMKYFIKWLTGKYLIRRFVEYCLAKQEKPIQKQNQSLKNITALCFNLPLLSHN